MRKIVLPLPGLLLAVVVAIAALYLGTLVPLVGAPIFGIAIGFLLRNVVGRPESASHGIAFASKRVLQWAVILLGSDLSLSQVVATGRESLAVMVGTLSAAFLAALVAGRLLRVRNKMTTLIGVGTAICGGSAIAAVSPIIEAEEIEIAYAMSTIFLFNVVAVLLFPLIGHLLGLSDQAFGMWAGTAINDTSSVVAAGYAYGTSAGNFATIVKLTRTTMIIPTALALVVVMMARRRKRSAFLVPAGAAADSAFVAEGSGSAGEDGRAPSAEQAFSLRRIFPWFVLGFLAMSLAKTIGLFPVVVGEDLAGAGRFLIVVALAGVGMSADVKKIAAAGIRPLAVGLIVWATVALTGLLVQRLVGFA